MEFEIETSPDLLKCSYATKAPDFLSTLTSTLSWICLVTRNEIENHIALCTGYWLGDTFHLCPMEITGWSCSWTKTFNHAVVACLDHTVPENPLLLASFPIAHQLAAVHKPIQVDQGLIYHGGFTALVPIKMRSDGSVLWKFKISDSLLMVHNIKCMKKRWYQRRSWYQTLDLDALQSAPALIS